MYVHICQIEGQLMNQATFSDLLVGRSCQRVIPFRNNEMLRRARFSRMFQLNRERKFRAR